jgi:thiol-disulfide isomerase/thioredoxin
MRWTAGAVSTRAPADEAFAFTPPKAFTRVDDLALAPARNDDEGPRYKVQALVGKPAPDFTLTVLEGPETTKTVSKADLAGKVVVIDFWATWCAPCLAELPQIQTLIESLVKDKKEVVVVALSQDDDPKDPIEVRKLIDKTLKDKKISLVGAPVGRVALDPSNTIGEAFQIEGYPTVVILDGKGVVRSSHVGFSREVGKTLAAEVDALLEGKPIPREKEKQDDAK